MVMHQCYIMLMINCSISFMCLYQWNSGVVEWLHLTCNLRITSRMWVWIPSEAIHYFFKQETLSMLLSIDWSQEWKWEWFPKLKSFFQSQTKIDMYRLLESIKLLTYIKQNMFFTVQPYVSAKENVLRQAIGFSRELTCTAAGNPIPDESQMYWSREGVPLDNKNKYVLNSSQFYWKVL